MTRKKVLMAAPVHPVLSEGLIAAGYELVTAEQISQQAAYTLLADCSGVITSTRLQLDRDLLDAAPLLAFIGRMGSGMEVVDTAYAAERGIACFSSPEGNCNAVAEHAMGMLLALNKRIAVSNREVQAGHWLRDENRGTELEGKTIAIVGYGHTGRALVRKLRGFDMQVLVYDKYAVPTPAEGIVVCDSLDPMYDADILSFHVPIRTDTHHYFDAAFLARMNKNFILLNTSRGTVIDNEVLLAGITSGKIAGACLDVWEEEPLSKMSDRQLLILQQIAGRDNVLITPHIAGYSHEALYKMSHILLEKIMSHLSTH